MNLPNCCTAPLTHWPLPQALPGAILVSSQFDPKALASDDFERCGIAPPASIQRSVAKRQAEYLTGRLCAREALRQLGQPNQVPPIGEDRAPVWPAGVSGSITHGSNWAAAIVAHSNAYRSLGLDMETLLAAERAERLAGEILTAQELQRLPREQVALGVTLTFSLKESLFKALYPLVGKRFYFEHAELLEWSDDGQARLRLLTDLNEQWHHGVEVQGQFSVEGERLLSLVSIPR
ncbi:MAG: 4'-phosphopantetheinyl transferase [Pseudomonas sp.]|nr:4'-phosphopantetheinyl transferase [Pseudomonas sp.]